VSDSDHKTNKVILFTGSLTVVGGAQRLMFEEAEYLEKHDFESYILTADFKRDVLFNQTYKPNMHVFNTKYNSKNLLIRTAYRILALRRKIREIKPDIIISSSAWDCIYFYFATLFTPFIYVTHIHGTIFWFVDALEKYAIIHKRVFNEIRESVIGHKEFIPARPPKCNLAERIKAEVLAIAVFFAVRKAKKIFVLSNQMKWEVGKLYGKEALVLKGAFSNNVLDYKPKQNIKQKLGLGDKRIILNINRLDPRKRLDLLIKAFKQIYECVDDVVLIIGGVGGEEENLKNLAEQLKIADKIRFMGYIKEEELWDYYAGCDVFVHPNWADFAIAPYEALALNRKVVWSTEMEIDEHLVSDGHIFTANPNVDDFARAIEEALAADVTERNDLSSYTWDRYCEGIMRELEATIKA